MRKLVSALLVLLAPLALALEMRPPARQISVGTNNFTVILVPGMTSTSTVQNALDWIDDNWPTNISRTNAYATIGYVDAGDAAVSNWVWYVLTNTPYATQSWATNRLTNYVTHPHLSNTLEHYWDTNGVIDYHAANSHANRGFIKGMFPNWVSTTQLSVTNGEGYVSNIYFRSAAPITHNITVAANTNVVYLYVDYSASTFPTTVVLTNTTAAPTYSGALQGWYNGMDRCIGAVVTTNNGAGSTGGIIPFARTVGGEYRWLGSNKRSLVTGGSPTGEWIYGTDWSALLPANCSHLYVNIDAEEDTDNDAAIGALTTKEIDDAVGTVGDSPTGHLLLTAAEFEANTSGWMPVGPSRRVSWWGENDDKNDFDASIGGYMLWR